jgi:hypothetical protein
MGEPSPSTGMPFNLKPDGKVSTNWQTLVAVIVCTAVLVGGLLSVKNDIANAASKAKEAADDSKNALNVAQEIRNELMQLRWQLGIVPTPVSVAPSHKPTSRNTP